jgi:isochorismate synthase
MEEVLLLQDSIVQRYKLSDVFSQCKQKNFGCAIYRLPQSDLINVIIDFQGGSELDKVEIESLNPGFLFHPFSKDKHPVKYINKDIHITKKQSGKRIKLIESNLSSEEIEQKLKPISKNVPEPSGDVSSPSQPESSTSDKNFYLNLIDQTLEKIRQNQFQKAVVSRRKTISLPPKFEPVSFFDELCAQYENAFVHLTYIPGAGTWAGASPETLIKLSKENQFETVALAATQAYDPQIDLSEITWSQKDIEEQAMVSRFIINCFKKIRLREFDEIGPRTYRSGNLVHLKTNYKVDLNQVAFPELGSVMLELLHPTSAVCGMPKDVTKSFLEEHEAFNREYFSGYLGPVNMYNETSLYVNLRCTRLLDQEAVLYAGAGIIENSKPEKEWLETQIKMDSILSVLKKFV